MDPKTFLTLLWSAAFVPLLLSASLGGQLPPRLQIQTTDAGQVRLQWPVGDGLYGLEERLSLDSASSWKASAQAPVIAAPLFQVQLPPTNHTRFFRLAQIIQPDPGVSPEPAAQAPAAPPNVEQSFADSTSFLYAGTNAVQLGVGPDVIAPQRASVLRGRALKKDGSPLPGVHVRVLNHPELGFTYTRADGMYDLSVNGGPQYTLDFQLRGYCPAQRQIEAPAQDFRCLPDLILVPADPIATVVSFGTAAPLQVAKSSVNTDKAGSRSATVLFPPGTCATVLLPDGSTQNCAGLTIRATEFTVGPDGPKAMPGPLPPSSAYTYAVELSGDEATAAGAKTVKFNQFVHVYVDNFLGIPTGGLIPNAYYDRDVAAWVPQENGVVIKILDTRSGTAVIDLDGDNVPEKDATLAAAQFTSEELQHLAAAYPSGTTLWRMPVAHFTAFDFNCPVNPANPGNPNAPGDKGKGNGSDQANGGGTVDLVSQIFQETIPLSGLPMDLHYSSARVPGYKVNAQVTLPLTGDALFPNLIKVGMDFEVGGRLSERNYPAQTNLSDTYGWDGYDAYGRFVGGTRAGHFRMFYYYPSVYGGHPLLSAIGVAAIGYGPPLFGNYGKFTSTIGHNEVGQAVSVAFDRQFTIPDHRKLGLGGWSLTPQHFYDPASRTLYRGDGQIEKPDSLVNSILVTSLENLDTRKVAALSDGSIVVVDRLGRILRMASNGLFVSMNASTVDKTTLVGNYGSFSLIDGTPASQIYMNQVPCYGLAVGPDDSIYYRTPFEILRFTPDGIMHVVLGRSGALVFGEDGTPANQSFASGNSNGGLAVGADGSVYYGDTWDIQGKRYDFVRKISPDGRLTTLAGTGGRNPDVFNAFADTQGYGQLALNCVTTGVNEVAVGPDGSVYFSDTYNVNRITPGGILTTVLNGRPLTQVGLPGRNDLGPLDHEISEGSPAVSSNPPRGGGVSPAVYHFKVASDGTVYAATSQSQWFLWKVDSAGNFQRVAGKWNAPSESGLLPLESNPGEIVDFAIDKAGAITMLSWLSGSGWSLRRIGPALPGFDAIELQVASRDGSELYVFNSGGLHLRTINTLNGATNWLFNYNASNQVVSLRDQYGLVTSVERDSSGAPAALVGPYGQRTRLKVDAAGFLTSVTNPGGEESLLTHGSSGLLTSIKGPRGDAFNITYDPSGRATRMSDPIGGFTTVQYQDAVGPDYSTSTSTSAGDQSTRVVKLASNRDSVVATTQPDATLETNVFPVSGGSIQTNADGTLITQMMGPDPRFPAQTLIPARLVITFPGGLQSTITASRTATFYSPVDPLSLSNLQSTVTVNGNVFTDSLDVLQTGETRLIRTSPEGRTETRNYDSAARFVGAAFSGETGFTNHYDSFGRIVSVSDQTSGGLRTRVFDYNSQGQLRRTTDPLGQSTEFAYDAVGRPTSIVLRDGATVAIDYDAENHLTGIIPPGRTRHAFAFNPAGLLEKYTPPNLGRDESVAYLYNSDRNLTNVALPDGQNLALSLGPSGRVEQLAPGTGPAVTFRYDQTTGQLTSLSNSLGDAISLGYQGALPAFTRWSGTVTGTVSMQYNQELETASVAVNGTALNYSYDRDGLTTKAASVDISRDAASGRVVTNRAGVVVESFAYDELGLLTNQTLVVSGAVLWSIGLRHDPLNRVTNRTELLAGATQISNYAYDAGGRLLEVREGNVVVAAYRYDENGNRLSRNSESAVYDGQDRLVSYGSDTFEWSPNGYRSSRLSGTQKTAYRYDVRGMLASVDLPAKTILYVHDPVGRRIARRSDGTLVRGWLWNGDRVVAELNDRSVAASLFAYGAQSTTPVLMIAGTNQYRLVSDERGSVRWVINIADGNIAQEIEYDEFGRLRKDTNPGFQPFGFAGGLTDPDTGLVQFGLRDYDPSTGQWTSRDPLGFQGGQFNLYAYCGNDPIDFSDPTGTGPFSRPGSAPQLPDDAAALVYELNGPEAEVIRNGHIIARGHAVKGLRMRIGDQIKTGKNTTAGVEFLLGGKVGVRADTTVELLDDGEVQSSRSWKDNFFLKGHIGIWQKFNRPLRPVNIQTNGGVLGGIKG